MLPEKEVEDIRIGMNGNISRWYDSLPRIPKESTDKLLQPIKLIQGCQKQKDELEKKKQKQMIELTRKERIWTQLENVIWKEAHFNREKTMK